MFIKFVRISFLVFSFLTLSAWAPAAWAKIKVVATLPEFEWIAGQIAGGEAQTQSMLSGKEDPHYVDASPSFVFKAAKADVLIYNGMQLEEGWLPKVLQMSGNSKIQPNEKGNCNASLKVEKLEVIENYDRSRGDIHPMGNPHYTLSPQRMIAAGERVRQCLEAFTGKDFKAGFEAYKKKMQSFHEKQKAKLAALKDKKFMVYHREFSYFMQDYQLAMLGSLEEVPGVLPSAAYLSKVAAQAKKEGVDLVLASSVSPGKYMDKFKELSGVDYVKVQIHPSSGEDYEVFFEKIVDKILKHAK